ncbi:transcription termination/antitermination protein NusG [Deferrisoma camini]|uniref:transcription termination/antitermination protein NusG n=1 Tax=Deferrisoma camini TaxID=1035120 RepID=UPI00046CA608|nr:transcription termination/antitermination protein NusG [Deferrisoma camini]NOY44772.1 transcription termination/antitermination protein NusG [Deltaproteobacteria bacterium]
MAKQWYVVQTYSGYENRVKAALEQRIREHGMEDRFGQILVPSEKVVEVVKGEKRTTSRKFFPGYILVQMEMDTDAWYLVKNTPKVSGFVGGGVKPTPISDEEVEKIIGQMEEGRAHPKPKYEFSRGEQVKVIDGPFSNFTGVVEDVNPDKGKLRVLVSIFGRSTPVELEFFQVEKT